MSKALCLKRCHVHCVGAFIVFDVTRTDSFEAIQKWKNDLDTKVLLPDGRPIPCVLLGNKCDQSAANDKFKNNKEMDTFCKEKGFAGYFATSAKDNQNVEESAKFMIEKVIENEKNTSRYGFDQADTIDLLTYRKSQMKLRNSDNKCKC